ICTVKLGLEALQPPVLDAPEEPPPSFLTELCRSTELTPSISRRRWRVSATSDWVAAQPVRVIVGTLPGGVAELAVAPVEPAVVAAGALAVDVLVAVPAPIVPSSEAIEASRGSTRPSSWNACAQSKRESTTASTALTRSSRSAMKLVYGASAVADSSAWR